MPPISNVHSHDSDVRLRRKLVDLHCVPMQPALKRNYKDRKKNSVYNISFHSEKIALMKLNTAYEIKHK